MLGGNLTQEQKNYAHKLALAEIYQKDLFKFTKYGLGNDLLSEPTHGPICRMLEDPSSRKLIVCPRGAFKSTICSIAYPIWLLIRDPNERILIDSEVFGNSKNYIRQIKTYLESEALKGLFGEFKTTDDWTGARFTIAQRTKHRKEPSVWAGGVGTIRTGAHFSTIIADDLNSHKNSMTPENCDKVRNHYRYYTSLLEPDGKIVVVGTRYSALDVIQMILDNEINGGLSERTN